MKNCLKLFFLIGLVTVKASVTVLAAPALPRYGINEQTKECSQFFMGDECMNCFMPDGWKMIEEFKCPEEYTEVQAKSICIRQKNPFCCTLLHSGANGDCDDVIVDDIEKKCAFVEDIAKCAELPGNWNRAREIDRWGRVCPSHEYEWLEKNLECEKE